MKPGDEIVGEDGRRFEILSGPVAIQGWEGCQNARCTRTGLVKRADGSWDMGLCVGWHCPDCGASTGSYGHKCPERGEA